ncbi:MAG TPA: hypothetical protein VF713_13520 [Thermoanaerobaculia bacterium]
MPRRKVPETNAIRHDLMPVSYMRRFILSVLRSLDFCIMAVT